MLKTLGSMRILCPVPELPCPGREVVVFADAFCLDLDTRPGTEDLSISSSSSCSAFIPVSRPNSDSLNIFCSLLGF